MQLADCRHLNEIEMDKLFINAIHSALKGALCAYVIKEHFRTFRQKFGANKTHRELLVEECSNLKTRVVEVEGVMKETLDSVDKLQVDLDAAHASNLGLKSRAKSAKDQVALLQYQVLEFQAQAEKARATSTRVAKLEAKLQDTVAQGEEMFVQGQDFCSRPRFCEEGADEAFFF